MAEFVEVSLQFARMCKMCDKYNCEGCPLCGLAYCNTSRGVCTREDYKKAEAIIMKWAKENPEPVYPTWWEYNSVALETFVHPERCIYLLGAEDNGIPESILTRCQNTVQLIGEFCYNVSTAGSIVMYDRAVKMIGKGVGSDG